MEELREFVLGYERYVCDMTPNDSFDAIVLTNKTHIYGLALGSWEKRQPIPIVSTIIVSSLLGPYKKFCACAIRNDTMSCSK